MEKFTVIWLSLVTAQDSVSPGKEEEEVHMYDGGPPRIYIALYVMLAWLGEGK
jgi:hypothetical protein